jgi:hypothetical protein
MGRGVENEAKARKEGQMTKYPSPNEPRSSNDERDAAHGEAVMSSAATLAGIRRPDETK